MALKIYRISTLLSTFHALKPQGNCKVFAANTGFVTSALRINNPGTTVRSCLGLKILVTDIRNLVIRSKYKLYNALGTCWPKFDRYFAELLRKYSPFPGFFKRRSSEQNAICFDNKMAMIIRTHKAPASLTSFYLPFYAASTDQTWPPSHVLQLLLHIRQWWLNKTQSCFVFQTFCLSNFV